MFAVTFLASYSKYRCCSLTLQSTSCWRHGRNMVAALWPWVKLWLVLHCLGSPLEGLAGAPALPLALPSIGACTSLKSVVPQRKSCFSHCVSPLPTFPLLSHCASKARGVCTEVLLWALCKLSPGSSPYSHIRRRNLSLELDAGYYGTYCTSAMRVGTFFKNLKGV